MIENGEASFSPLVSGVRISEHGNEMEYRSTGISKFEYAVIHLAAGLNTNSDLGVYPAIDYAIEQAVYLFEKLEKLK
jgi:hypothetical protein